MFNSSQNFAIKSDSNRILVLAGAGTGKTSVMVHRIARLVENGVDPHKIIATTFTNKAANELLTRLASLVSNSAYSIYCGTFHKISAQILRLHGKLIGLEHNFQLLTDDDQKRIVKGFLKDFPIDEKPKIVVDYISQYKESGTFKENNSWFFKIFDLYQKTLEENNLVDYSDLIDKAVRLFNEFPDLASDLCQYVLVDEYQDINGLQYEWIKALSLHASLFCVGDEDQSIYAFRGANIKYIQSFSEDFPDAEIIKLEENYRSCSQILKRAVSLISKNRKKYSKNLIAANTNLSGFVRIDKVFNEYEESSIIAKKIIEYQKNFPNYTIGILVRTNQQVFVIEQALVDNNIPYKISAGRKFYDKKEILDLVSYLRAVNSSDDFLAFSRIINVPKRGIGNVKQNMFLDAMKSLNCNFETALNTLIQELPRLVMEKCKIFLSQIKKWRSMIENRPVEILNCILKDINYIELEEIKDKKNIEALRDHISQYENLTSFLENLQFSFEEDESNDVHLMTMHSAKGLEFDVVIAPGWEENIFPSALSRTIEELEEERRLAYVTITRAKRCLEILYACCRKWNGKFSNQMPSRFIFDL